MPGLFIYGLIMSLRKEIPRFRRVRSGLYRADQQDRTLFLKHVSRPFPGWTVRVMDRITKHVVLSDSTTSGTIKSSREWVFDVYNYRYETRLSHVVHELVFETSIFDRKLDAIRAAMDAPDPKPYQIVSPYLLYGTSGSAMTTAIGDRSVVASTGWTTHYVWS